MNATAGRPRRVLVVDDNADAAQSLSLLLDVLGFETRCALDGPRAIREAGAFGPDVVLLDIGMPGMDGYEVARALRPVHPAARLIALTGYGRDDDRLRSREAGFDDHLLKPVDIEQLQKLLAQ